MRTKNLCFWVFACCLACLRPGLLSAQDNWVEDLVHPTPNAASLGKYGDIPVSYHTGLPNISIPLFTLQDGSLQLPISLSYHGGGIKVEETASWVGLGFSLNAGGVISRTVRNAPDEDTRLDQQFVAVEVNHIAGRSSELV